MGEAAQARVLAVRAKDPRSVQTEIAEDGVLSDDVEILASVPIRGHFGFSRVLLTPFYGADAAERALREAERAAAEYRHASGPRTIATLQKDRHGGLILDQEYLAFLRSQLEDPTTTSLTPAAALQLLDALELQVAEAEYVKDMANVGLAKWREMVAVVPGYFEDAARGYDDEGP